MVSEQKVHFVLDYWDQPRSGVADVDGKPHYYDCVFDEALDEYSDLYRLTEANQRVLSLCDWIRDRFATWLETSGDTRTHPLKTSDEYRRAITELKSAPLLGQARTFRAEFSFVPDPLMPKHRQPLAAGTWVVRWSAV